MVFNYLFLKPPKSIPELKRELCWRAITIKLLKKQLSWWIQKWWGQKKWRRRKERKNKKGSLEEMILKKLNNKEIGKTKPWKLSPSGYLTFTNETLENCKHIILFIWCLWREQSSKVVWLRTLFFYFFSFSVCITCVA